MSGHGCDGLAETIEMVVSVISCERRKATERRRKACWDLENFHQVPDPVGRNTCCSTRIWAFSIVFALALRRDDSFRRAAIGCHMEQQP